MEPRLDRLSRTGIPPACTELQGCQGLGVRRGRTGPGCRWQLEHNCHVFTQRVREKRHRIVTEGDRSRAMNALQPRSSALLRSAREPAPHSERPNTHVTVTSHVRTSKSKMTAAWPTSVRRHTIVWMFHSLMVQSLQQQARRDKLQTHERREGR